MLGKRLINTGGAGACTTDTVQILDSSSTQSTALYRFEDNPNSDVGFGKFGGAAKFEISGSYATIPSWGQSQSSDADYSLSFWIKFESLPTTGSGYVDIINDSSGAGPIQLYIYGVSGGGHAISLQRYLGAYYYNSGYNSTAAKYDNFQTGQWYHIAISYVASGKNVSVYINGTQSGITNSTYSLNLATSNYSAGSTDVNVRNQRGFLDQFRVFNKAISSSEVTTLYQETLSTVNTLQVLGDTSCIATYTFDANSNDLSTNYNATSVTNVTYNLNGTESSITYATGKFGNAAVFNGSSSKIDLPAILPTNSTADSSVSFWFKYDGGQSGTGTLFSSFGGNTSQPGYHLGLEAAYTYGGVSYPDGSLYLTGYSMGTGSGVNGTTSYADGQWHHVVVTYDFSTGVLSCFVDNPSSATLSITYSSRPSTIGPFSQSGNIGYQAHGGPHRYAKCSIDQFRIFDKALRQGEVNSLYNETTTTAALGTIDNPSTVAYYKMQDATDETGSYNGTATNVDFNVQGKYGFAGKFNGTSSYISGTVGATATTSFSMWVKINDPSTSSGEFIQVFDNNNFAIFIYSGKLNIQYASGSNSNGVAWTISNASNWNHIAGTFTSSSSTLYVNGVQKTESMNNWVNAESVPHIGNRNSLDGYFNGQIDQVRIFNKAISANEVTKLYSEVQCANTITAPENYFQTKLYTGGGSQDVILNFAPDFVWIKDRSAGNWHNLQDTIRGATKHVYSNANNAQDTTSDGLTAFNSNGFTVGAGGGFGNSGNNFVSWNWKAGGAPTATNSAGAGVAPTPGSVMIDGVSSTAALAGNVQVEKMSVNTAAQFSIVNFISQTGSTNQVPHGLNGVPDLFIFKRTDSSESWWTYTQVIDGSLDYFSLNTTDSKSDATETAPTATTVYQPTSSSGRDYILYCFKNVDGYQRIGSYVGNGSTNGPFVYTGFEPAFILFKRTDSGDRWLMADNKRADALTNMDDFLDAQDSAQEETFGATDGINFLSNGFSISTTDGVLNGNGGTYIYLAIAANPDTTTPTKANSFETVLYTGNNTSRSITTTFQPDFVWLKCRDSNRNHRLFDSIRGATKGLYSDLANAEYTENSLTAFNANGFTLGTSGNQNVLNEDYVAWAWKALDHDRNLASINNDGIITSSVSANTDAGFSIVKYTATGTTATVGHGLSSAPELILSKTASAAYDWLVYAAPVGATKQMRLNATTGANISGFMNNTAPTSSVYTVASGNNLNYANGDVNVAYCFTSITGHSKIGSYSGDDSTDRLITTGFNVSFVMIKKTNGSSNWQTFDSARGGDEQLDFNSSADEFTGSSATIEFVSNGFRIKTNYTTYNATGGEYIYMAFK